MVWTVSGVVQSGIGLCGAARCGTMWCGRVVQGCVVQLEALASSLSLCYLPSEGFLCLLKADVMLD